MPSPPPGPWPRAQGEQQEGCGAEVGQPVGTSRMAGRRAVHGGLMGFLCRPEQVRVATVVVGSTQSRPEVGQVARPPRVQAAPGLDGCSKGGDGDIGNRS
jgi:hypothetical protein